jgi:tetratricopeptide (TPR) repeat protein
MEEKSKTSIEIAWGYYEKKEIDNAIKKCNSLIKVKKYFLEVNYLLGIIYFDKKDFCQSLNYFTEIINSDLRNKENGFTYYRIGLNYNYGGSWFDEKNVLYDKAKAKEFFLKSKACKFYPADVIFELSNMEDNNLEKIDLYNEGIEKFSANYDFYIKAAKLYEKMGYESKQLEIFELALLNKLESTSLFYNLGEYYYKNRDNQKAIQFFKKCLSLNTHENSKKFINFILGRTYYSIGNFKQASFHYNSALNLGDSDNDNLLIVLGLILTYKKQNQLVKSTSLIKKIPLDKNLFEFINFDYGIASYLDGDDMERSYLKYNPVELIQLLVEIKNGFIDSKETIKVDLILCTLYEETKSNLERLKILRSYTQIPSGFEFIGSLLAQTYRELLEDFNLTVIKLFIKDIENPIFDIELIIEKVVSKVFKNSDYVNVVEICKKINDTKKVEFNLLFHYAYSLNEIGNTSEAKYFYETYLKKNPKSTAVLNNLGLIYRNEGDLLKAISSFKLAERYNSEQVLYKDNLKDTYIMLEKQNENEKINKIPENWIQSVRNINVSKLEEFEYFGLIKKIEKINQKYRPLIERDFKELIFNYLVGNFKSTIVISGSLVEMILTYQCEKRKFKLIPVENSKGVVVNKKLYDCVLNDLIGFIESQKSFGNDFQHLGNLARVYRNFIHPGLELKGKIDIKSKADLCIISAMEILKKII